MTETKKPRPFGRGFLVSSDQRTGRSEPVQDLVGPEALEPVQRLVERAELLAADAADLLNGAHVLLIELLDDVAHVDALLGQLDAHRTTVDARALVVEEAHL